MLTTTNESETAPAGAEEALAPGTTLLNKQFEIERYLSAGGFGITYLARDSLQRPVVIKECYPEAFCSRDKKNVRARSRAHQGEFRSFVQLFVKEARSLSKLNHPNVVGVHQVFEDNDTAYMALDLIDGVDLLSIIEDPEQSLPPDQIQQILLKVLDAVALIHSQDMLHRDISPDNILIDKSGSPVLIDFGAAREEASKKSRALSSVLVVKDGYSPQEFYFGGSRQGPFSDIYALGATFYHLISGTAPPHSQTRLAEIAGQNPDPCAPLAGRFPTFPMSFLSAIDKSMSVFPKNRLQSALEWSQWIETDGAASPDVQRALENEASIKALMKSLPQRLPDQTAQMAAVKRQNEKVEPARPVHVLDFSDLRERGVQRYRRPTLAREDPSPVTATRIRKPFARLVASVVLAGSALAATHPSSTYWSETAAVQSNLSVLLTSL